ncbi:orotate phosphoribosyltransferase [Oceanobacillus limi]|uniref:Orotate phosphoribosyltransferase n=1 Tax=Oceanobacillus limi TaxID=930131 RepID=A0A1I0DFN9_9BACI|nr:orotate phosphoribosyltransferase [Oceanobacillus limi]SET31001.1 orotate phosphoribosyltransferase [Oceanobacillus limi]
MKLDKEISKDLLRIEAVQIEPENYFTWTSGMKAPIYCDNRITMSFPDVRKKITKAFSKKIEAMSEKPDVIAGCATAGIPHAAWLADLLNKPMVYVRSKPKGHGKGNQIEGSIKPGQKVIVIEDLISTGGSSIEAAQALQEEGAEVLGVMAIFTYGLETARANFFKNDFSFDTITSFDILVDNLVENKQIDDATKAKLLLWRNSL